MLCAGYANSGTCPSEFRFDSTLNLCVLRNYNQTVCEQGILCSSYNGALNLNTTLTSATCEEDGGETSGGLIAGIVIGSLLFLLILIIIICLVLKKTNAGPNHENNQRQDT